MITAAASKQNHVYLSPTVADAESSEFSIAMVVCFECHCISVTVIFANVGQFCVNYLAEILTVNVIYASVSIQI